MNQVSIVEPVTVTGVNVYNGRKNAATFHSLPEDSGLVFIVDGAHVPASLDAAEHMRRAVGLGHQNGRVLLVEHLLSAVYALGIDNLAIELSDGVCPTTDNCAGEYFDALKEIRGEQTLPKQFWSYDGEGITIRSPEKRKPDSLTVAPSKGFVVDYTAYYPHRAVGEQHFRFALDEDAYAEEISTARSPAFIVNGLLGTALKVVNQLGFYRGVNERNYLLIKGKNAEHYANPPEFGVRFGEEEFVRHKTLDVFGTLALTGRAFVDTEFRFEMTGHRFDLYALKKLFTEQHFKTYKQ